MGTLATARDQFLQSSGRFDLGTVGGEDNGANFFINSAQRFLDRKQETPHSFRRYQTDFPIGMGSYEIQDLIAVKSVHIKTELGLIKLYPQDYNELFEIYNPADSTQQGSPLYYSFSTGGLAPQLQDLNNSTYTEQFTRMFEDLTFGNLWQIKVLVIRPVPDIAGTLSLVGRFYSPLLREDEDRSYWTESGEQALIFASLYMLEASMRNSTATKFWYDLLRTEINSIDDAIILQDMYDKPMGIQG